jgi:hypothetical protein
VGRDGRVREREDDIVRILVCGSRDWPSAETIHPYIAASPRGTVFIHGGARGADQIADTFARAMGYEVEVFPADWAGKGRRAGVIRNLEMLDSKPDGVVAFWKDESPGTGHMIREAKKRGIPVDIVTLEERGTQLELAPKPPKLSTCRTCRRSIIWVRTERGKKMPLDADPVEDQTQANLFVLRERESREAPLAIAAWGLAGLEDHYMGHPATCPGADVHQSTNRRSEQPPEDPAWRKGYRYRG